MRKILCKLNNIRFHNKMMIIYFGCIILPLIMLSILYYNSTINKLEKQRMQDISYSLEIIKKSLQNHFENTIALTNKAYLSESLYKLMNNRSSNAMDNINVTNSIDEIMNYLPVYNSIDFVSLYSDNMLLYKSSKVHVIDQQVKKQTWFINFTEQKNNMIFSLYTAPTLDDSKTDKHFSIIRKLDYFKQYSNVIILKVDMKIDYIRSILNEQNVDGVLYLLDDSSNIICSSKKETELATFQHYSELQIDKHNTGIAQNLVLPNGWKVVADINGRKSYKMFTTETNSFIILMILYIVFTSIIIWYISKSIVGRLKLLTECVRKIKREQFELIEESEAGEDEVGMLVLGMNGAIKKIKELIEDVYQSKIRNTEIELEKRRAELNALHSQINPHFIFNVLEVIRMKSVVKKETDTARIIKYLSRMFRRSINWGEDLITVGEEMAFIHEYLEIQRYRFGDKFAMNIEVNDEALNCNIPKMTLQIFIENACMHGLEGKSGDKFIKVKIWCDEEKLSCIVEDNGIGIDQQTLQSIIEANQMKEGPKERVGIKNVLRRLQLYYGDQYSFKIISQPDEMTKILLELPITTVLQSEGLENA